MNDIRRTSRLRPEAFQFASEPHGASRFHSKLGRVFTDAEEMELAVELLKVASEAQLEQFIGDLLKKAWRGIKSAGSNLIRPLGGVLKAVAKEALPFAATAAGAFFGGPAGGAIAGKLGSLVSQALEAAAAGMAAADRDLEKCRQFVRMAGKAARAAAAAPTGVNPIALAEKILADSAKEKLARKASPVGPAGNFAKGAPAAASMNTAGAAGRTARQKSETGTPVPGGRSCSICEQPLRVCQCGKINRSGRWWRRGGSIIVNC